jgi:F0F1-type ATP synthase membrane subunit a
MYPEIFIPNGGKRWTLEYCFSTWTSFSYLVCSSSFITTFSITSNADRIPHGFQNFMEAAVDFVTDIAKDQLGESFL